VVVCVLAFPVIAQAQFPAPTYGWNLGNTLEPPCGEGCWAPAATQAMINKVADSGFNTIRIPVAWNSHANQSTYQIAPTWLNRVKQVVDWSLAADLTVVINTHWDGGWFENNIGSTVNPTINAKMDSYWTQIATTFSGPAYDERLLFAAANEPNVNTVAQMSTLSTYYQTFVDAVRDVGGSNANRWLVLPGPYTNIDSTYNMMNTLPTDTTEDRLAVEVHYYDPWQFAGLDADANWGNMFYFWGDENHSATLPSRNATHSEEAWLLGQLQKMHDKFVSQGVPVILGEFGAMNRTGNPQLTGENLELHLASRLYYHQLIVDTANSLGIAPFYWDNGHTGTNGSGIFNRNTTAATDPDTVTALTGGPRLPGDYNDDGVVDAADYTVWRNALDGSGTLENETESLGVVDQLDYDAWKANFGNTALGAGGLASNVPEPTPFALAFCGTICYLLGRRLRRDLPLCCTPLSDLLRQRACSQSSLAGCFSQPRTSRTPPSL
jgi:aryl-phospho-beta-D-glucosidase BglC (GH1 family)